MSDLIVQRNVEMKTRDGVTLRADIYRPSLGDQLPVLLQRTPYGKGFASVPFAMMAAERGYAVIIQDTRGRWGSEGEFYPFVYEADDGYDTVEWAAAQPWAAGSVGMFGASYVGYTQFSATSARPPALKAIAPMVTFCDPGAVWYSGGAVALGVAVSWILVTEVLPTVMALPVTDPRRAELLDEVATAIDGMAGGDTFRRLPMRDMPLVGREGVSSVVADVVQHRACDDRWRSATCAHSAVQIPALHIGGWYDIFAKSTLRDYAGITSAGHAFQKAIVGPWLHGPMDGLVGEVDFGIRASAAMLLPDEIQLRWFDHWLKGVDTGMADEPPISLFVMGENVWRSESEWPLARAIDSRFYLHSAGSANTGDGDGGLSQRAPSDEPVDSFVYDPRNPVPTRGGGLCCWRAGLNPGAFDQRDVESRPDVLVYSSQPLMQDIEVTGEIEVHLWAATTARDTDFTAKLVDVSACGFARNIVDGIVRARYRRSLDDAELPTPGEVYEYVIDLGPTSNVFKAGHRFRLEISSSNFPRFDRNLNTGNPVGEDSLMQTAVQTILHDASHPSHVVLPVVPK